MILFTMNNTNWQYELKINSSTYNLLYKAIWYMKHYKYNRAFIITDYLQRNNVPCWVINQCTDYAIFDEVENDIDMVQVSEFYKK